MNTLRHIIRFIRAIHPHNSDILTAHHDVGVHEYITGLPECIAILWDATR